MQVRVVPQSAWRVMPWKNGRGTTTEVCTGGLPQSVGAGTPFGVRERARAEPAPWSWRLSIADVPEPGPFSRFAGVDRWIACVRGDGMRLRVGGQWRVVPALGEAITFAGEDPVDGEPLGPGVQDVNLMVVRAHWSATMAVVRTSGSPQMLAADASPPQQVIVHALDGPAIVVWGATRVCIEQGETAVLERGGGSGARIGARADDHGVVRGGASHSPPHGGSEALSVSGNGHRAVVGLLRAAAGGR